MAVAIQFCPPHAAHQIESPEPQFTHRAMPVHLPDKDSEGDGYAGGLSFQDFSGMSTLKASGVLRRTIPPFMLDPVKLREVIVLAVEARAFGNSKKFRARIKGSLTARLKRAEAKITSTRARKIAIINSLCDLYVKSTDPIEKRKLAVNIEGLDTTLCLLDRPAAIITAILFLSYRVGLDSIGVSQYLGGRVHPPMVRQILSRCRKLAGMPSASRVLSPEERALRDQIRADQKEARRLLREQKHAARLAALEAKRNARLLEKAARDAEHLERQQRAKAEIEYNKPAARRARGECWCCGKKSTDGFKTCAVIRKYYKDRAERKKAAQ